MIIYIHCLTAVWLWNRFILIMHSLNRVCLIYSPQTPCIISLINESWILVNRWKHWIKRGQDNGKYLKEKNRNVLHISTFSVNRLNRRSPLPSISDERSNYDKRQNIKLNSWLHTWIVDSGIRYTACWFIYWYKCMPYNILIYINSRKLHL